MMRTGLDGEAGGLGSPRLYVKNIGVEEKRKGKES